MTYPAATANLVVLWGRWWDHLTKAGVDATITATPLLATGQAGSGSPNLVSLVDQAEIKTAAWTTKPLAASGLWALPLLPTNDAQFGAFGGYRIQCGSEPPFIVEILENTPTMTMSADMIAALNEARLQSSAAAIGISVDDVAQAVWVRQAAVLPQPAVTPPTGVLTSDQVVNLVAGVRQLPPGGTPGQVPSPKASGGYEWITGGAGGGSAPVDATPETKGISRLLAGTADAPLVPSTAIAQGGSTWPDSVLPRVTINTVGGAPILNREDYVDATITINGAQPYSGTTQIRGRGNTTWTQAKKPYRLKLTTSAPLLGMPAERDWVLLANYIDPLSIRNAVAFEIAARCSGLSWTPRMRFVEVVLNGVFLGLYQLGEHVELSAQKVNVTKAAGTTGLALTGAYTLEIDQRKDGTYFTTATKALPIVMDDPDGAVAEQKSYIEQWVNNFENVLFGASWLDPTTGYARFIDRDSFIDWYLVNELCMNIDSNFYSSCKFYKTRDTATVPGRLVMGPVWDFDRSLNSNNGATLPPTGFHTRVASEGGVHPGALWLDRMLGDPAFMSALVTRWAALTATLRSGDSVDAVIDRLIDRLTAASARDRRTWSRTVDTGVSGDAVRAWIRTRMDWLSTQFVLDTTAPTAPSNLTAAAGNAQIALTWNPATDNVAVVKYRLRRGATIIAEPAGTSYVDTGLTNGTAQSYTVTALDAAGNESAASAAATATPSATDTAAPSVPTNLAASGGDAQTTLTWTASTDNVAVASYRVRRGGVLIASPTAPGYTDTGLTNGTAYSYTVSAVDTAGNESAQTAAVSATPGATSTVGGVTGMGLWWDVAALTAPTDQSAVASVPDSSGNGRSGAQAASALQPIMRTAGIGSKRGLRFNASRLESAWVPQTGAGPRTVVMVIADCAPASGYFEHLLHWGANSTGRAYGPVQRFAGSSVFGNHCWSSGATSTVVPNATPRVLTLAYDGATDRMYDGTAKIAELAIPLDTGSATPLRVGQSITNGEPGTFTLGELVVWNRLLTDTERGNVVAALKSKWAVA